MCVWPSLHEKGCELCHISQCLASLLTRSLTCSLTCSFTELTHPTHFPLPRPLPPFLGLRLACLWYCYGLPYKQRGCELCHISQFLSYSYLSAFAYSFSLLLNELTQVTHPPIHPLSLSSLTHLLAHSLTHSLQDDKGTTLVPTKTLLPPPLEHLYCGLPSPEWQSDHMSLVTDFSVQRRVSKNSILLSGLHKEANMVRARSKLVDSEVFEAAMVNRNRQESSISKRA